MRLIASSVVTLAVFAFSSAAPGQTGQLPAGLDNCLAEIGDQVFIEGGEFIMGQDDTYIEEGPAHPVTISAFWIDSHEVTNAQFAEFIAATGYVTVAQRQPDPEDWPADIPEAFLKPGSTVFTPPLPGSRVTNWWAWVPGSNWLHPDGPGSDIEGKANYPVIHVAYEDAAAYANWAGRSLPSEAQFELVARNKHDGLFAWDGNELAPDGHHHANTWQGEFPGENTAEDKHPGLAPVGCFAANAYGAYDLIGNVWEWTSNWYAPMHLAQQASDPAGPAQEDSYSPMHGGFPVKVIKGGSYLCAENYCLRFRPAARQAQDTGLGTSHIGFRTVLNRK